MAISELGQDEGSVVARLYPRDAERWRAEKAWPWRRGGRPWAFGERAADGSLTGFVSAAPARVRLLDHTYEAAQVAGGELAFHLADAETNGRLYDALFDRLRADGVQLVYAAVPDERVELLQGLGFRWLFEAFGRNLYVSLDRVSSRLSRAALDPLRRFAKGARRLRPKLMESELDLVTVRQLAALFGQEPADDTLTLVKDEAYLRWRYLEDPRHSYRAFTYRSRAGQGVSAFALVRRFEPAGGRPILHVDELWTRRGSRRDLAKLLGELALVALSEEADALRCVAVSSSQTEQALIGLGCIRKKVDRHVMLKWLVDDPPTLPDPFATRDVHLVAGDLALYET